MAPLWPYSQSLQNITQVNETKKVSPCMRIGAAWSPGSAWQREAPTASRDRRFRLMSSHWDQRMCFAKCSSCFQKKSHAAATGHRGPLVHWWPKSDAELLRSTVQGGSWGWAPSRRSLLVGDGKQRGLQNMAFYAKWASSSPDVLLP